MCVTLNAAFPDYFWTVRPFGVVSADAKRTTNGCDTVALYFTRREDGETRVKKKISERGRPDRCDRIWVASAAYFANRAIGPYLRGSEPDDGRQVFAFGRRQVPLLPEPAFQFVRLRLAEQHAALAFLVHRAAVRRMAARAARAAAGRTRPVVVGTGRGRDVVVELVVHLVRVRLRRFSLAADPGLRSATAADACSDDNAAAADDRSVGCQPAGRARRVRQVGHARRRAVRAGLLRAVIDAEPCGHVNERIVLLRDGA